MTITLLQGDCRDMLDTLDAESVQTIVTSPPYWRMRRYTDDPREIGQEPTPAAYVAALVDVFDRCWRVLRSDGTLWLNLGDVFANDGKWGGIHGSDGPGRTKVTTGLPPKSLIGLPWRVAFALQDYGWILRADIVWEKPNAMPESVQDRPTRSHEYVFLFSKSPRYYYDAAAIAERATAGYNGSSFTKGKTHDSRAHLAAVGQKERIEKETRNARTVWSINTTGLADEHYAPMPPELAKRCIRAGSKAGDTVLDPFGGSGTTRTDGVQVELFV
jgi:DNA modification methylase